jgi:predicted TIM-barrel enzyme
MHNNHSAIADIHRFNIDMESEPLNPGTIGAAAALTLDEAINKVMGMADAAWKINSDLMVICHGGPFDEPENVGTALEKMPGIIGFYGASSAERLPTERAIKRQVEAFKALRLAPR